VKSQALTTYDHVDHYHFPGAVGAPHRYCHRRARSL